MGVYVDDARIRWRGRRWSHLWADSPDELHRAAAALGLRREWAQEKGRTLHYDLPDHLRELAIVIGVAQAVEWREGARLRLTAKRVAVAGVGRGGSGNDGAVAERAETPR